MLDLVRERLFENAGKRIKKLALIMFVVECIAAAITLILGFIGALIEFDFQEDSIGVLLLPFIYAVVVIAAWLLALPVYGFGELLEKTYEIANNTRPQDGMAVSPHGGTVAAKPMATASAEPAPTHWICKCGMKNANSSKVCKGCGSGRHPSVLPPIQVAEPQRETSKKCVCGERYYGAECPLCGRKN